ncbi:MAG: hypothetical protein K2X87_06530 [Gemmataceae bacterium]|nr:hypothetical protein [Gemmataceae bacterium]
MAKSGPAKFSAAVSMQGYLYQCRYALLLTLKRVRSGANVRVSVEKFDDVTFEAGGVARELVQTKHHTTPGDLSDLGEDWWKTLRVWSEGVRDKHFLLPGVVFTLVTTQNAPAGSAAALLRPDPATRDPSQAEKLLLAAAKASANQKLADAFDVFHKLPAAKRRALLAEVYVFDNTARIGDLDTPLLAELRLAAPRGREAAFLAEVEGWWFRRLIRHLETTGQPASRGGELEEEIERLRDGFCDDNLPVEKPLPEPPQTPNPAADARRFVQRLREVGLQDRAVRRAILDFYRATVHRDKWVTDTLLHFEELQDYDDRLLNEWDRLCDALFADATDPDRAAAGRRLFQRIDEDAARFQVFFIRPRCQEPCIGRGTLHQLADANRLAWHPDRVDAVRQPAAAGGTP